jgi:DNA mismatch repair ATPase MutS
MRVVDVRHPLLATAVPNSIDLLQPNGILITGSNMSGKSTFLRTIGVTAVMAQTINTCLALKYEGPVFHVQSAIGRSDDITTGTSYYLAEVESLVALVDSSVTERRCLFLLDELFRGTNAVERVAAGEAVLRALVSADGRPTPHVAIAATHDAEIVDLLADCYSVCHFSDSVEADGLAFDYRLRSGPATTRNAIALLRLKGAPTAVVDRAFQTAAMLDRQRVTQH